MFLENYIQTKHARQLSTIEDCIESGDPCEFEISVLISCLLGDPELTEYSDEEFQSAICELINLDPSTI